MKRGFVGIICLAWLVGAIVGGPALASDGVLEVNQACVAAGCFSGDSGGFPVTIANSGSYILTSHLTVPDVNTDAIQLTSGRVKLDLNGFVISATGGGCTGCPVTSCTSGTGRGIYSTSLLEVISISNGTVRGMGAAGINIIAPLEIDHVSLHQNAGGGAIITSGPAAVWRSGIGNNGNDGVSGPTVAISDSVAACNQDDGIEVGAGSKVNSVASFANGGDGIYVTGGSTVNGSTSRLNGGIGIRAVDSTVVGNSAQANTGDGFFIVGGSSVSLNTAQGNTGAGILCGDGVTVSSNTMRSNLGFGLVVGTGSGYVGNVLTCNNSAGVCNNVAQVSGAGLSLGTNLCGTDTTCP